MEGEKHRCERETWLVASRTLPIGGQPATQACALPGNQTSDLSVLRPVLSSLSHSTQGRQRLLHFIQKNTVYCRRYFSILWKPNSGKLWVWEKIVLFLSGMGLYCHFLTEAEVSVVTLTMENKCMKLKNRLWTSKG